MLAVNDRYDDFPDDPVHCTECERAVDAVGSRKQGHSENCSHNPAFAARCDKAAADLVSERLEGAIGRSGGMRFTDIVEKNTTRLTYQRGKPPLCKFESGLWVMARIWVSDAEILEVV